MESKNNPDYVDFAMDFTKMLLLIWVVATSMNPRHAVAEPALFLLPLQGRTPADGTCAQSPRHRQRRNIRIYNVQQPAAWPSESAKTMLETEPATMTHRRYCIYFLLFLEDDLGIDDALPGVLLDLVNCPVRSWLVVRLESMRGRILNPVGTKFVGTRVADLSDSAGLYRLRTHVLGAGAYLIRREGAACMLSYGKRIFMPMDRSWENGILPYIVRPLPVRQRPEFETTIGARPVGRHQSQPFAIRLNRRLQRIRDGVRKRVFNLDH